MDEFLGQPRVAESLAAVAEQRALVALDELVERSAEVAASDACDQLGFFARSVTASCPCHGPTLFKGVRSPAPLQFTVGRNLTGGDRAAGVGPFRAGCGDPISIRVATLKEAAMTARLTGLVLAVLAVLLAAGGTRIGAPCRRVGDRVVHGHRVVHGDGVAEARPRPTAPTPRSASPTR